MALTDTARISRRRVRREVDWRRVLTGWAFVLPALLLVAALVLYPLGFGAVISAFDYDLVSRTGYFVGLDNFQSLLDGPFLASATVTLTFLVPSVLVELAIGVGLALILQAKCVDRARPIVLAVILMPMLMAPVVAGSTFKLLLNPEIGLVSRLLGGMDILGNRQLALAALVVMDIWMWTPFVVLLVSAALMGISPEVMEAAALDGAGPWQRFRLILLPLLRPVLVVVVLFRVIDSVKVADIFYIMTQGGPGSSTNVVSLLIYRTSFSTFNIGLGAAMSAVLVVFLMIPVLALYRSMARNGKR